eukprot:2837473-Alexandrium_andersonii.AAC.1
MVPVAGVLPPGPAAVLAAVAGGALRSWSRVAGWPEATSEAAWGVIAALGLGSRAVPVMRTFLPDTGTLG